MEGAAFLVFRDGAGRSIGIDASVVARVTPEREWTGEAPVAIEELLGLAPRDATSRVLVLEREGRRAIYRVPVGLALRRVTGAAICPLPEVFRRQPRRFSDVVFDDERPAMLVADVEALLIPQ